MIKFLFKVLMAVPKKKTSKSKKNSRKSVWQRSIIPKSEKYFSFVKKISMDKTLILKYFRENKMSIIGFSKIKTEASPLPFKPRKSRFLKVFTKFLDI